MLYFAYGSNMSRQRLEQRIGPTPVEGVAMLPDHAHAFNKLGIDGTAKGNLIPTPGHKAYGVVYTLTAPQFQQLATFENGYRRVTMKVHLLAHLTEPLKTSTFLAINPTEGIVPSPAYVSHYEQGMREHALPTRYIEEIRRQARASATPNQDR